MGPAGQVTPQSSTVFWSCQSWVRHGDARGEGASELLPLAVWGIQSARGSQKGRGMRAARSDRGASQGPVQRTGPPALAARQWTQASDESCQGDSLR